MIFLITLYIFFSNLLYSQETIGIYTYCFSELPEWDKDSIKKGIAGSEEAVIYLSESLAKLGYKVIIFGKPPKDSLYTTDESNPKYVSIDKFNDIKKMDVFISCRNPFISQFLKTKADKVLLWPHDTPPFSTVNEEIIKAFDEVIWISKWQRECWLNYHSAFQNYPNIYGNGIVLEQFNSKEKEISNPYSCIYGSNYARGLEILLEIWPEVKASFPEATLDIYYGWQTWGLFTQEKINTLKEKLKKLEILDVREHGLVGHLELHQAFEKASFWTYPCIAPETFCITAIKAQYCGAIPVIIEGSALSETVRYGYKTNTKEDYLKVLLKTMREVKNISNIERQKMRQFIVEEYTWDRIALKIQEFLKKN